MHICAFCAYINGLSNTKPKVENYNLLEIPYEFKYLETSGACVTHDYKVIPRNDSCFFDKTEMLLLDPLAKYKMKFLIKKIICDSCMIELYQSKKLIVISELSEQNKLFRLYLRSQ
jgi:hypothetical protein